MTTRQRLAYLKAGWLGIALLSICLTSLASSLQLVSIPDSSFPPPAGGDGDSTLPIVSRDGRFVLFVSTANNLVSLTTNQPLPAPFPAPLNVYLRDRTKGTTVLVSVNLSGTGGGDADSIPIGVSTNGRYALFESSADNLVDGDTNNAGDVFLRDLQSGVTRLVSVSIDGGFGDNSSYNSAMSPDARYVAFASAASNLVAGDTNGIPDVFIRDLESNVTSLVSIGSQPGTNSPLTIESDAPSVTPDGRYVLFYSTARNLAPGVQTAGDLYLRDRVSNTTIWVSSAVKSLLGTLGSVTNTVSFNAALSDDGQHVAFESIAFPNGTPAAILRYSVQTAQTELTDTNAVPQFAQAYGGIQDLGMTPDGRFVAYVVNAIDSSGSTTAIRVWDAQSGTSVLASGDLTNGVIQGSLVDSPAISDNGQFVAFLSDAPNVVTNEVTDDFHIYLRDLKAATTTLIDADTNGVGVLVASISGAVMSADGSFIAFDSQDSSLVPADRNRAYDVFLRDLSRNGIELISPHDPALPSFTPNGPSACSSFGVSADAHLIAFWSEGDDLVADDTNEDRDVFVRDILAGTTSLVSVNTNGTVADGFSTDPAISADGRYVAFSSFADDIVPGDTNGAQDVFVRDLQARTTVLASVNPAGGAANADSYSPVISSSGRSVLFRSRAGNMISPAMPVGPENIFLRDLESNRTYALTTNGVTAAAMAPDGGLVAYITSSSRISQNSDRLFLWSSQSNAIVYSLSGVGFTSTAISPDGHWLAYVTNNQSTARLFGVDRMLNTNFLIASYVSSSSSALRFDPSSRYLAYLASSGPTSSVTQVYLFDFQTGINRLVTQSYDGVSPGNNNSDSIDVSSGGRFVAFRSAATNLVPGDTNGVPDVFLYDGLSGAITLISANRFGTASADNRSLSPIFSADGQTLVFTSWASDLVTNDFNYNADVFTLKLSAGGITPGFSVLALPGTWLTWPASIGKSYRVQFKNNLDEPEWHDLTQAVSIMGSRASVQDAAQTSGQRFYRVIAY